MSSEPEMTQDKPRHTTDLIAHTATIVAAYAARRDVQDLPALIREVYDTLRSLETGDKAGTTLSGVTQKPAVPVQKSIMPDYIVCLEDGKKLKMLKRYLKTAYGMTPEQYREKWDLPADYPMVAPNYAEKRSHLAKESGLGSSSKKRRK